MPSQQVASMIALGSLCGISVASLWTTPVCFDRLPGIGFFQSCLRIQLYGVSKVFFFEVSSSKNNIQEISRKLNSLQDYRSVCTVQSLKVQCVTMGS